MKKLLLTLFAVAAVFVACDKDTYEDQFEVIAPEVEEVSSSIDSAFFLDAKNVFDGFLGSGAISSSDKSGDSSSARPGDNGANWIQILIFDLNGKRVGHARADNFGEACLPAGATQHFYATYYWDPVTEILRIESEDGTLGAPIGGGFRTALYNNAFALTTHNVVLEVNTNNTAKIGAPVLNVADYDFSCATVYEYGTRIIGGAHDGRVIIPADPTDMDAASNPSAAAVGTDNIQLQVVRREAGFGVLVWENVGDPFTNPNYVPSARTWTMTQSGDVKTFTHADLGRYTVEPAPFPLTGSLATMRTQTGAAATRTVSNYAGTGEQAVRDAIEDDYEGR